MASWLLTAGHKQGVLGLELLDAHRMRAGFTTELPRTLPSLSGASRHADCHGGTLASPVAMALQLNIALPPPPFYQLYGEWGTLLYALLCVPNFPRALCEARARCCRPPPRYARCECACGRRCSGCRSQQC